MAASRTIVVAGAGIGGLTASLALARQGFRVIILEKAERLEEAGAGLQLSPNASRVLVDLGLRPRLSGTVTPEAICLMSASSGGEITRLPLDQDPDSAAPYWVIHRADLQAALRDAVQDNPDIELRLGCQFEDVSSHAKGLTVIQRSGPTRREELALALDRRRRHLVSGPSPFASRSAAALLRADCLAWHARYHAVAARIYIPPRSALDGPRRAPCDLSDFRCAPDQRGRGRVRRVEQARLERARRRQRDQDRVRQRRMARHPAHAGWRGRRLAKMGAVHGPRR